MTYDQFEDVAANTRHADAERKVVVEPSAELELLQLGGFTNALQSHNQQSVDPCRQSTDQQTVGSLSQGSLCDGEL